MRELLNDFDNAKIIIKYFQSCVHIPLRENSACDMIQVKLFGGDEVIPACGYYRYSIANFLKLFHS